MENAKLHEELGRAHVVCRAAVQFAQVVETFRTNSPASAFPLAGVAENFRASSPHDTPNRMPADSRAAGKDDALQPPTPPQHVRFSTGRQRRGVGVNGVSSRTTAAE
mmetsp:Transcript_14705/g.47897  ORF Transcript_14705/g.47897 Transcript_14705/m.47897 type:complete len:107 (+) Transcript_14705:168-488(+)